MRLFEIFKRSISDLCTINKVQQPWHLPLLGAACAGLPCAVGTYFNDFASGLFACFAALVVLYMPTANLARKMTTLAVCSFGFTTCFALGSLSAFNPWFFIVVLMFTSWLVIVVCRYYRVPPPGSFFFIMLVIISGVHPFSITEVPQKVGLIALGTMSTCLLAFLYSLGPGRCIGNDMGMTMPETRINAIILEGLTIAFFIAGSLLVAELLALDNPYWVPISCAAILQGATFRMMWHRNVHRIWGTLVGLVLVWFLLRLELPPWYMVVVVILLQALIEFFIPRNYGLAVIFITSITLLFAEAHIPVGVSLDSLVVARMTDILLGSFIGCAGGWVIHQTRFFNFCERKLDKLGLFANSER